jgi:hypothetical protein
MIDPRKTMERAASERPRAVTVIGWTFLILALLRLLQDGVGDVDWRFSGLREGLPIPGVSDPRIHFVDDLIRNLAAKNVMNAALIVGGC